MDVQVRDPHAQLKRRGFQVCALVIIGCVPIDWLQLGQFSWLTFGVRVLWAGLVAALAWHMPRGSSRFHAWAGSLAGVGSALALGLLALLTGGAESPIYHWLLAIPLAVVALLHVDVRAVLWVSLVCLAWTLGLSLQAQVAPAQLFEWCIMQLASGVIAVWSAITLRRLIRAREDEAQARTEALARLALSEQHRMQSEQLALVGRLAAGVAHEVNNPLAYVRTNLGCIEDAFASPDEFTDEELRELFAESREGLDRIRQIVTDLRTFSRTDPLVVTPSNLMTLVDESVRMAKVRLKHVAPVELEVDQGLPQVLVHERHFVQVLLNLLVNAADALEEAKTQGAQVWIRAKQREGTVEIVVEDNGPGIPEPALPRLFEPFFTTKPAGRGTGLGLPLSREYVEQLSGSLTVGERPGGGARFTLCLPAVGPESAEALSPLPLAKIALARVPTVA